MSKLDKAVDRLLGVSSRVNESGPIYAELMSIAMNLKNLAGRCGRFQSKVKDISNDLQDISSELGSEEE